MLVNSMRLLSRTSLRHNGSLIMRQSSVLLSRNLISHRSFSSASRIRFQYSPTLMNNEQKNKDQDKDNKKKKQDSQDENEWSQEELEENLRKRLNEELKKNKSEYKVGKVKITQVDLNMIMRNLQLSILGLLLIAYLVFSQADTNHEELSFQDFVTNYLERGLVTKLTVINKFAVEAELVSGAASLHSGIPVPKVVFTIGSIEYFEDELNQVQDRLNIPLNERIPIVYEERTSWLSYLMPILPTILLIGGLYYITARRVQPPGGARGGGGAGPFGFGKSTAKLFNQETDVKIKFKDVAGCDESKEEIMEFVKFLQDPKKYEKLGAKIPRGAILSGPPGTGKTLLAKATAGEAGVPFLSVSGSEFVEMFVGVGASRVRDLFKTAREMAPAIIFVDEIDAIGKERGGGKFGGGGNDEREATLNQLLVEMDGFSSSDHIVVIAGTNRPDVLDKALLRPGRFDRHISIDVPDVEGRKEIFKVHLNKLKLKVIDDINIHEKSIDFEKYKSMKDSKIDGLAGRLAALTPGFAGADIANVCNEGALIAAREDCSSVETYHFEQAIERVIAGLEKKSRMLTLEEKKTVSYHEAGHAICGWYLEFSDPLVKVSIIPRGQGALGYAQYLPKDQYLTSKEQYKHQMIMALGGRVSEELHFDTVTSGASDDFKKVTQMAQSMILKLGMSERLGKINYDEDSERTIHHLYSEETAQIIDEEVKRLIDEAYKKCHELLTEKLDLVDKVAKELYKKEVLTREDMIRLCGPRPFPDRNDAFDKYIKGGEDPFQKRKPTNEI